MHQQKRRSHRPDAVDVVAVADEDVVLVVDTVVGFAPACRRNICNYNIINIITDIDQAKYKKDFVQSYDKQTVETIPFQTERTDVTAHETPQNRHHSSLNTCSHSL